MEQKEFYEKLQKITDALNSTFGSFDDAGGDWRIYDQLDLLIRNSQASESVKEDLRRIQRKLRIVYLSIRDLGEQLAKYD